MFQRATSKLEDARTALYRLLDVAKPAIETNIRITNSESEQIDPVGTDNPVAFKEAFVSFVTNIDAVRDATLGIQKFLRSENFKEWVTSKNREIRDDELLWFMGGRRDKNLHQGLDLLTFVMHPYAISLNSSTASSPPEPDATLIVEERGIFWRVKQNTPHEHLVPYTPRPGYYVTVAVANPPATHRGKPLPSRGPITLCALTEKFYAEMLFDGKTKFAK